MCPAEANAITKVAGKPANNCDGSTLYITAAPCIECSKLIIQAGISEGWFTRRITVRKRG